MGLNGFTEWLLSALLGWMQLIYNWFWSMLASGGQNEFMPWFSDNWLTIVIVLLVGGLVVDYTIYLMRWQPYHIWLTALRRARGYVSHPFNRDSAKPRYAGYRKVLEGVGAEPDDAPPARSAKAPRGGVRAARPAEAPARVYEAAPRVAVRPTAARDRYARRDDYAPQESYATQDDYAPQESYAPQDDYAPYADGSDAAYDPQEADAYPYSDEQPAEPAPPQGAIDAEGYEPERVLTPSELEYLPVDDAPVQHEDAAPEEPLFSEPPRFVNSERDAMPVYGRAYQTPAQAFMPIPPAESRRPQVELPDMTPPVFDEPAPVAPAPVMAERVAPMQPPVAAETVAQPAPVMAERVAPVQQPAPVAPAPVAEERVAQPAPQPVKPAQQTTARTDDERQSRLPEGYASRRRRNAPRPAPAQPVYTTQTKPAPAQPVYEAQTKPAPAQPVYAVQTKPAPAQPVYEAQTKSAPAQPVYEAQTKPAPVQPVYTAQTKPAPVQPVYAAQTKSAPAQPVYEAQPVSRPAAAPTGRDNARRYAPGQPNAPRAAEPAPRPRVISVRETAQTRDMDFDDEID